MCCVESRGAPPRNCPVTFGHQRNPPHPSEESYWHRHSYSKPVQNYMACGAVFLFNLSLNIVCARYLHDAHKSPWSEWLTCCSNTSRLLSGLFNAGNCKTMDAHMLPRGIWVRARNQFWLWLFTVQISQSS